MALPLQKEDDHHYDDQDDYSPDTTNCDNQDWKALCKSNYI